MRPDDRYCRYCDQSVDYSVHPHNHSSGLISTFFQCIPTQLLQHKSWTSFAARRTSRLTVWPAPVVHHRSCCASLNCCHHSPVGTGLHPHRQGGDTLWVVSMVVSQWQGQFLSDQVAAWFSTLPEVRATQTQSTAKYQREMTCISIKET